MLVFFFFFWQFFFFGHTDGIKPFNVLPPDDILSSKILICQLPVNKLSFIIALYMRLEIVSLQYVKLSKECKLLNSNVSSIIKKEM